MAGLEKMGLFGIKDAGNITFYSRKDNKPKLYIPYANNFKVDIKSDSAEARAKGEKAIVWDKAKEGSAVIGVEMASTELFAFLMGSPFKESVATQFHGRDAFEITTNDQQVTLKDSPITGSVVAYKIGADGATHLAEIVNPTVSTNKVTLSGTIKGDRVAVYYLTEKTANKFSVAAKKELTEDYTLVALTEAKTYANGDLRPIELEIFKVAPQSNISFEFDAENPSKFEITVDILVDITKGEKGAMLDWKEIPTV